MTVFRYKACQMTWRHLCCPASCIHESTLTAGMLYRGADKSLAQPGRKQSRKHVRDARVFNNIETLAVIKFFFFLQGKAPKEIHAILTETLACFLPFRVKDLSAPLYSNASVYDQSVCALCLMRDAQINGCLYLLPGSRFNRLLPLAKLLLFSAPLLAGWLSSVS